MILRLFTLIGIVFFLNSCVSVRGSGEKMGKDASDWLEGLSKGMTEVEKCTIEPQKNISNKGIFFGRYRVTTSSKSFNVQENSLILYTIANKDFNGKILIKVYDYNGAEYGRTTKTIELKNGEAKYITYLFDKETKLEPKSKFIIEFIDETTNM